MMHFFTATVFINAGRETTIRIKFNNLFHLFGRLFVNIAHFFGRLFDKPLLFV